MEGPLTSAGLIASLILAAATYELIEKGFRKLKIETAFRPLIIGMLQRRALPQFSSFQAASIIDIRRRFLLARGRPWTSRICAAMLKKKCEPRRNFGMGRLPRRTSLFPITEGVS